MFERLFAASNRKGLLFSTATFLILFPLAIILADGPRAFSRPAEATSDAALLEGYRHVEVSSVSDAMEKTTGRPTYLFHRMQPLFLRGFGQLALTRELR